MTEKQFTSLYQTFLAGRAGEETLRLLAPYKVKNAVILAAGMATRFAPVSSEKPKGLVHIRGEVLIERQIRQLREAGIREIVIVTGYKNELFRYLEETPGVRLLVNEDYARYNNSSSLLTAKEYIGNSYICSSDNYFTENVFEPYVFRPYYSAVRADEDGDEYCLETTRSGRICRVTWEEIRGKWSMRGHVYFDNAFSRKFLPFLEKAFAADEAVRTHFWEYCYVENLDRFRLWIRKYPADVVREFDTPEEAIAFDPSFDIHQA